MCRMPVETTREEMASEQNALSQKDSVAYCYTVSDWFKKSAKNEDSIWHKVIGQKYDVYKCETYFKNIILHCFFFK